MTDMMRRKSIRYGNENIVQKLIEHSFSIFVRKRDIWVGILQT